MASSTTPRSKNLDAITNSHRSSNISLSPSKLSTTSTSHLSPWRFKVTVEAERDDEEEEEEEDLSSPSSRTLRKQDIVSRSISSDIRQRLVARTIKVPLKGGSDSDFSEDTLNMDNQDVQQKDDTLHFLESLTPQKVAPKQSLAKRKPTPGRPLKANSPLKQTIHTTAPEIDIVAQSGGKRQVLKKGTPGRKKKSQSTMNNLENVAVSEENAIISPIKRGRGRPRGTPASKRASTPRKAKKDAAGAVASDAAVPIDSADPFLDLATLESHNPLITKDVLYSKLSTQRGHEQDASNIISIHVPSPSASRTSSVLPDDVVSSTSYSSKSTTKGILNEVTNNHGFRNSLKSNQKNKDLRTKVSSHAEEYEESILASEGFSMIAPDSSILSSFTSHHDNVMLQSPRTTPNVSTDSVFGQNNFAILIPTSSSKRARNYKELQDRETNQDHEPIKRIRLEVSDLRKEASANPPISPQLESFEDSSVEMHSALSNTSYDYGRSQPPSPSGSQQSFTRIPVSSLTQLDVRKELDMSNDARKDISYPDLSDMRDRYSSVNISKQEVSQGSFATANSDTDDIPKSIQDATYLASAQAEKVSDNIEQYSHGFLSFLKPSDSYVVPGTYNETTHFDHPILKASKEDSMKSDKSGCEVGLRKARSLQNKQWTDHVIVKDVQDHHVLAISEQNLESILPEELFQNNTIDTSFASAQPHISDIYDKFVEKETTKSTSQTVVDRSVRWETAAIDSPLSIKNNIAIFTSSTTENIESVIEDSLSVGEYPIRLLENIKIVEPHRPNIRLLPDGTKKPLVLPQKWESHHWTILTDLLYPQQPVHRRLESMSDLYKNETEQEAFQQRKQILDTFAKDKRGRLALSGEESKAIDEFEEVMRRELVGKKKLAGETRREWGFSRGQIREALIMVKVGRERRKKWILDAGHSLEEWGL